MTMPSMATPPRARRTAGLAVTLLALAGLAVSPLAVATPATAADLQVCVSGFRSERGDVRVALFRTPEDFPSKDGRYREVVFEVVEAALRAVFADVPPGIYGLAAFHDENGNGDFDQGLFGLPLEGFAFGNDAPIGLGPPSFDEASIAIVDRDLSTTMSIRYFTVSVTDSAAGSGPPPRPGC